MHLFMISENIAILSVMISFKLRFWFANHNRCHTIICSCIFMISKKYCNFDPHDFLKNCDFDLLMIISATLVMILWFLYDCGRLQWFTGINRKVCYDPGEQVGLCYCKTVTRIHQRRTGPVQETGRYYYYYYYNTYRVHKFKQARVRGAAVARWGTWLAGKGK